MHLKLTSVSSLCFKVLPEQYSITRPFQESIGSMCKIPPLLQSPGADLIYPDDADVYLALTSVQESLRCRHDQGAESGHVVDNLVENYPQK